LTASEELHAGPSTCGQRSTSRLDPHGAVASELLRGRRRAAVGRRRACRATRPPIECPTSTMSLPP